MVPRCDLILSINVRASRDRISRTHSMSILIMSAFASPGPRQPLGPLPIHLNYLVWSSLAVIQAATSPWRRRKSSPFHQYVRAHVTVGAARSPAAEAAPPSCPAVPPPAYAQHALRNVDERILFVNGRLPAAPFYRALKSWPSAVL